MSTRNFSALLILALAACGAPDQAPTGTRSRSDHDAVPADEGDAECRLGTTDCADLRVESLVRLGADTPATEQSAGTQIWTGQPTRFLIKVNNSGRRASLPPTVVLACEAIDQPILVEASAHLERGVALTDRIELALELEFEQPGIYACAAEILADEPDANRTNNRMIAPTYRVASLGVASLHASGHCSGEPTVGATVVNHHQTDDYGAFGGFYIQASDDSWHPLCDSPIVSLPAGQSRLLSCAPTSQIPGRARIALVTNGHVFEQTVVLSRKATRIWR